MVAGSVSVPHLELWPKITQDEVQVLELGRTALDPDTDWSMGWLIEESKPRPAGPFSSTIIQELAYSLTAPSNFGPRFASMLGAMLAATLALGWLLARQTPPLAAFILACAFLLDPIFNFSYRQARIDSWAFAFILAACWLLQVARGLSDAEQRRRWATFSAGMFAGCAPSVWVTTYALMPLVLLELVYVLHAVGKKRHGSSWFRVLPEAIPFVAGAAATFITLHLSVLLHWDAWLSNIETDLRVQIAGSFIQRNIIDMYVLYDPMILLAICASLLMRRELGLLLALAISLVMMYQTMIYPMRILYLLPYFVALIAGACTMVSQGGGGPRRKVILIASLGLLVFWNAGVSLAYRPIVAHAQKEARSPDQIRKALNELIGPGSYRVLLEEWDMYYAARSLGWKSYKVYGPLRRSSLKFREFLESMDYVIQRDKFEHLVLSNSQLKDAGFRQISKLSFIQPLETGIRIGPFRIRSQYPVYEDVLVYKKILGLDEFTDR